MNFREKAKALVAKMTLQEKISQMTHEAAAIERLSIPAYNWWSECLHGVARAGVATVFPQVIGMAASFNTHLIFEVASAISDEARAKYNEFRKHCKSAIYQGITMCAPNINIFRDPRWGRGHETFGEDPYLTGKMASAYIKGLQGEKKFRKVDATLKHYAVHSGPEGMRHRFNAVVSKRDLFETYLWAFKYCIDNADPSAVMGAYSAVNGEPCCASKTLLKEILRDKFGFKGYVESDAGAVADINKNHKITCSLMESAALSVRNGCDLNIGNAYKELMQAYDAGMIDEETITGSVERLFEARFRLGMFDDCEYDNIPFDVVECGRYRELNLKMAQEGIVLLKNDGILPLKKIKSVAIIGPNADDKEVLLGNYNGTPSIYATFLRGIQESTDAKVYYDSGCKVPGSRDYKNSAVIAAVNAEVVIMVMGLNPGLEGEESDACGSRISGDKLDLELPASQKVLYDEIKSLGKPMVFVNVSGSCINLCDQDENCNAVIQCFYPGAEGGRALADILFGKISPSGRLPVTFYRSVEDLPPFEDYSMENRTYKYFKGTPLYPFGHGLSYTNFEYSSLILKDSTVSIVVKNTGNMAASEVVQLYGKQDVIKLIDFNKVLLAPKEEKTITFELTDSFDQIYIGSGMPQYTNCLSDKS